MAGLLDLFKTEGAKYLRDILPGGLLNPEVPPDAPKTIAGLLPVVGDAISGYDALEAARRGDIGEAALNSLGLLPFVPAIGMQVKHWGTPEFKDFFGRSVLRTAEDNPQVMYHATPRDLSELTPGGANPNLSGPAIWMSPSKTDQPAAHNIRQVPGKPGHMYGNQSGKYTPGTNVMPLYARLENALGSSDLNWKEVYGQYGKGGSPWSMSKEYVDRLKKEGYDGIMHFDKEGNLVEAAVFDSTQVKSAIGNKGTYSRSEKDITK